MYESATTLPRPSCRAAVRHVAAVLLFAFTGCHQATQHTTTLRLDDGRLLSAAVAEHDTAVVILLDPADCISCSTSLTAWYNVHRTRPVYYVFTRAPKPTEAQLLARHRIGSLGVVSRRQATLSPREHRVMVFLRGVRWLEETVGRGQADGTILQRLGWGGAIT